MALFDALIDDVAHRFRLGAKRRAAREGGPGPDPGADGGIGGFLGPCKRAGLGAIAAAWLGKPDAAPLATGDVEKALGAPAARRDRPPPRRRPARRRRRPRLRAAEARRPPDAARRRPGRASGRGRGFPCAARAHAASGDDHGHGGEVKHIQPRAVAPAGCGRSITIASVVGLGWAVWPIIFPSQPPAATTIQSAAPAPAPSVAEAPEPRPLPPSRR